MKKIVLYISNMLIGGAQKMVFELAKALKGYNVVILVHGKREGNYLENLAESVVSVKYLGLRGRLTPRGFIKVMRTLDKLSPDVVHCHLGITYIGYLWCRLRKKKCVVTAHTSPEKAFTGKNERAVKRGLKRGDIKLVTVSEENRKLFSEKYGSDGVLCVNNGIDLSPFYRKPHDGYAFINVARQDENKNQALIIRCFAKLSREMSGVTLYMLGDGDKHEELIGTARDLGVEDKVIFTGNVSDVENYYALSDCFLLSSHREALPMTAIEAAAAGLAIISTDVGGMKDVVKGNGFLVKDEDEIAYYNAMKTVATEKKDYGDASYEIAKLFSSDTMSKYYGVIYE